MAEINSKKKNVSFSICHDFDNFIISFIFRDGDKVYFECTGDADELFENIINFFIDDDWIDIYNRKNEQDFKYLFVEFHYLYSRPVNYFYKSLEKIFIINNVYDLRECYYLFKVILKKSKKESHIIESFICNLEHAIKTIENSKGSI